MRIDRPIARSASRVELQAARAGPAGGAPRDRRRAESRGRSRRPGSGRTRRRRAHAGEDGPAMDARGAGAARARGPSRAGRRRSPASRRPARPTPSPTRPPAPIPRWPPTPAAPRAEPARRPRRFPWRSRAPTTTRPRSLIAGPPGTRPVGRRRPTAEPPRPTGDAVATAAARSPSLRNPESWTRIGALCPGHRCGQVGRRERFPPSRSSRASCVRDVDDSPRCPQGRGRLGGARARLPCRPAPPEADDRGRGVNAWRSSAPVRAAWPRPTFLPVASTSTSSRRDPGSAATAIRG